MNILKIKTDKRKIGDIGEGLAAKFLKRNGYKILERNYVQGDAEIDLICKKDDTVAFVEVKARTGDASPYEPRPASSVTPEKQRKIIKAASHYASLKCSGLKSRLDIVEVYLDGNNPKRAKDIKHLVGAFSKDTAFVKGRYNQ